MAFDLNEWHQWATRLAVDRLGGLLPELQAEVSKWAKVGVIVPDLVCADGFSMAVYAVAGTFCIPCADASWPYSHFEVRPREPDSLLTPYRNAYGQCLRVPVDVIEAVVSKHGGIAGGRGL